MSIRPIYSLKSFKNEGINVKVGDHLECRRCGKKTTLLDKK